MSDELTPDEVKSIVAEIDAWHADFIEPTNWRITAIEHFYDMPIECYLVNFVSGLSTVYVRNAYGLLRPASGFTYQAPAYDRAKVLEEAEDTARRRSQGAKDGWEIRRAKLESKQNDPSGK